ncbi:hypothetical protein EV175_005993 [Coemansia sp. RSA 1933]|nr:hypothetical protein EV175_005993 [Coemansia sp. RSA 1933]
MHPPVPPLQALASTSGISCWWRQQWHPRAFDLHELWEVTSPRPNSFPLHCRDARGVISPVPLTPMVLDRHQFCYRFHLAGNKMRWLAKRQGRYIKGLQCYVRGTAVAFLLFGECSADGSNGLGGGSWSQDEKQYAHLPQIVVLPEALHKLDPIDPAIVESFVLFTGIEVFECFMYDI